MVVFGYGCLVFFVFQSCACKSRSLHAVAACVFHKLEKLCCHAWVRTIPNSCEEQEEEDPDAAQRLGLNADPESIKCMRCGDPFDSHARAGTPAAARLLESRPLRKYLVTHPRVFVRSRRSTSGDPLGALRRGTEVSGCLEGNWLHLSQESARILNALPRGANPKAKYVDAWVLIDGASVGFQTDLLVPEGLAPPDLREQIQQEELLCCCCCFFLVHHGAPA